MATDPTAIIGALRDVLLEHMSDPDEWDLDWCRVERALIVAKSGRILAEEEFCDGDTPTGLMLTMGDGSEILLTVSNGVR